MKYTHSGKALRLGILGCANIAKQFVRDVGSSPAVVVVGVASRREEVAAEFARVHGIARHFGSYEALLADDHVDAVYIPLPNSMHEQWAIRCAQAGKHILCEKPLALGLDAVRRMFAAATAHNVILLESFPYYFQPQTGVMMDLLHERAIGDVGSVQASFGFTLANPESNIRMKPELGGGALLDAGSYPLSLIRLVMGLAPQRVVADATWSDSGVDISMMATLLYADGRRAQMECSMDTANHRHATLIGTRGTIETEYLNHTVASTGSSPYGYLPSQLRLRRGTANTIAFQAIQCASGSGFRFAAEAFAQLVERRDFEAMAVAAAASLDNAATLEAIALSAKHGRRESVAGR
jgi:predicted dehydrogenase